MGIVQHHYDPVLNPTQGIQKAHLQTRQIQQASHKSIVSDIDVDTVYKQDLIGVDTIENVHTGITREINSNVQIEGGNNRDLAEDSPIINEIERKKIILTK